MGQLTSVTSDRGSPAHGRALLLPCLRRCGGSWTGSRRRRRGYRHRHLRAPPTSVGDLSICSRSEWGAEPNCSPRRAPPEPHSAEGDVVGGMALPPPHERRGTRRLRRQCRLETSDDRLVAPPHGRRLVSVPCPSKDGWKGGGCVAAIHYETRKPHLPRPVRPPVASADLAGTPRARKLRVGTFITAALMWEAADLDYRDLFVRDGNDPDCCGLAGGTLADSRGGSSTPRRLRGGHGRNFPYRHQQPGGGAHASGTEGCHVQLSLPRTSRHRHQPPDSSSDRRSPAAVLLV